MKCKICGNIFYEKRRIIDLFKTDKQQICRKCVVSHGINIEFENIILDIYEARVVSLFKRKENIDYSLFMDDFSKIYNSLLLNDEYELLFFDHLRLTDEEVEKLDAITKLFDKNIIVMCLTKSDEY